MTLSGPLASSKSSPLPGGPLPPAELPVSVQLFKVLPYTPPPFPGTELLVKVQLKIVPPSAPPPEPVVELRMNKQFVTTGPGASQKTPPPLSAKPFVKVKPSRNVLVPR